ncbi:hypothetical protein [Rhodococcus sp. IEGM 1379]|uniref:hypothetical protein n=1 Tax=Rhodococcus sp. IEGM 1379 TaxID=3047086 RepID=UPI0024B87197|nr:hypothetical protein [Rhodococcus sp. IEGM 1379]MDI9916790.1 hypothetical protein [Rhodococcus sp. IEGM 1379]
MNIREVLETVESASVASDLFGPVSHDVAPRRAMKRRYYRLVSVIHPDRVCLGDVARSAAATARLNELYGIWVAQADSMNIGPVYIGERGEYRLGGSVASGSVSELYGARDQSGTSVVLKIPRDCRANSMIEAERNALGDIAHSGNSGWSVFYFPRLVDRVSHHDNVSGERREINVLNDLTGEFLTLSDVLAAYPNGLDPRDWAWMHRRLLRTLAVAHAQGWVHTAITADNILIHPDLHGVVLAGWSFATRPGDRPVATIASAHPSYPPELGGSVTPAWDVYMAHQLMSTMLGDRIPSRMKAFALGCMQSNPRLRPGAVDLLGEFDELLDLLHGERTFRVFTVPSTNWY